MIPQATTPPTMAPTSPGSALATTASAGLSLQIQSPDDLQRLARLFSASGLFGRSQGDPNAHMAECAIKILAGMEAGFGSFASIAGISVINGKPGFGANLLAQAIKRHPSYDYRVLEKTDTICRIRFLSGKETLGEEVFTIQMAERANLIGKGGPWKQYPEAMLFARCLSAGMRTHCPDALGGAPAYTPEELGAQGQIDENGVVVADVTPAPRMLSSTEDLAAGALKACEARGLTPAGLVAMVQELSNGEATELAQLPRNYLARLAKNGVSPESAERWNAVGEPPAEEEDPTDDPDDLPVAWAASA
jgi:hypothetical protein